MWFTPYTTVISAFVAGALISTLLAPALRCICAFSFEVKMPVHSMTISIPKSLHGRSSGFFSAKILIDLLPILIEDFLLLTFLDSVP